MRYFDAKFCVFGLKLSKIWNFWEIVWISVEILNEKLMFSNYLLDISREIWSFGSCIFVRNFSENFSVGLRDKCFPAERSSRKYVFLDITYGIWRWHRNSFRKDFVLYKYWLLRIQISENGMIVKFRIVNYLGDI